MKVYLVFHGKWDEEIQRVKKVFDTKEDAIWWLDRYLDNFKGVHWIEEHDLLLTGLGTFCTNECTSSEDLCKLIKKKEI